MIKLSEVRSTVLSPATPMLNTNAAVKPVTTGTIPQNVLQGLNKAGDLFPKHTLSLKTAIDPDFALGHIDWKNIGKVFNVAQLDQAEAMTQEAFKKASAPGASNLDKILAQQEASDAEQIRQSVAKNLTPAQKQALDQIMQEEEHAFKTVLTGGGGIFGAIGKLIAQSEMNDAAQKEKALDRSILS